MGEISSLKKRKKIPGMSGAYKHSKVIGLRWNLSTILMIIFTVLLFVFIFPENLFIVPAQSSVVLRGTIRRLSRPT